MLVLSRKPGEQIVIGDNITLTVCEIRGDKVRLGITAPHDVPVFRSELLEVQPPALRPDQHHPLPVVRPTGQPR